MKNLQVVRDESLKGLDCLTESLCSTYTHNEMIYFKSNDRDV